MEGVAQAAGISESSVWELEKRLTQRPSAPVLHHPATVLGVTVQDLLGEPAPAEGKPEDMAFFGKYLGMSEADGER